MRWLRIRAADFNNSCESRLDFSELLSQLVVLFLDFDAGNAFGLDGRPARPELTLKALAPRVSCG